MKVLLFAAFLFAVVTLTTGASARNDRKLNVKHSVKQHASGQVGYGPPTPEPENFSPDVGFDEGVIEDDLQGDDEWPGSDRDIVEQTETDLDWVNRSKYKRRARRAYSKGKKAYKKARKAAKKAAKKVAKKAKTTAKKTYTTAKKAAKKAKTTAKKTYTKAKKTAKKAYRRRRRRIRRRPRYTPATSPPRNTRPTRSPPKKYPPKKYPPKKYPPKYPTTRPTTRPPSKGSKLCRCRMVAKPAKECYSYINAEKGYCRLRNCDAKWECVTSGRSRHICMRRFAMEKIVPVGSKGKLTKCRTRRHRPKPFYVLYRTITSYPRPKPRPRPTRPGPYTRGTEPRYRRRSTESKPKVYRSKPKRAPPSQRRTRY